MDAKGVGGTGSAITVRRRTRPLSPPREPRTALELRIHGVHGTSPASMLGVKSPSQVAGDGITGVFRASGPLPRRTVRPGHAVEAYSWGALTSAVRGALGWVQRVLWLILLPFALINLAYWARLHVGQVGDDEHDRHVDDDITIVRSIWGAIIVRWAALVLTMLLVLAPSFIALDLVAWQCYRGATKSCDVLPGFLDFMMGLAPSQRMAVGTALPLAVIGLLWFLSRQTLARYEACKDTGTMAGGRHLLQDERFWSSTNRSRRLQRIHLAGAVATVMAYVAAQVGDLGAGWFAWFLTLVAGAVLVLCFAALTRAHPNDLEYRGKPTFTAGFPDRDAPVLLGLACAGMAILLAWLQWGLRDSSTGWDASQSWFGHNLWFIGTFVVLSALNTLVFVAGRHGVQPDGRLPVGRAGPVDPGGHGVGGVRLLRRRAGLAARRAPQPPGRGVERWWRRDDDRRRRLDRPAVHHRPRDGVGRLPQRPRAVGLGPDVPGWGGRGSCGGPPGQGRGGDRRRAPLEGRRAAGRRGAPGGRRRARVVLAAAR
jgi:hypothetical protein